MDFLDEKIYKDIKEQSIADHQRYFNRVAIDFGDTKQEIARLTTPQRLRRIQQAKQFDVIDDPDFFETYFQFGRYLLITSSRPGTLPANLQGIWNPFKIAPWSSDFHLNINLQMNYWLAETTALHEMHQPLLDFIQFMQPTGKKICQIYRFKRLGDGACY